MLGLLALCSCGERVGLAPVVELNWRAVNNNAKEHIVQRGETLFAIAFRYDQDYRQLATNNHLSSPYTVRVGQIIDLRPMGRPARATPLRRYPGINHHKPARQSVKNIYKNYNMGWLWPAHGRVVTSFAPQQGKKGINIAGSKGEKIHAANGGIVAYAGNGLAGYGNLIIIKHNNQYLTAYGNNSRNLVREGQRIQPGQAIAEMGVVDRHYWGVHFEIRKAGKPVNPLNYLKNS